MRGRGGRCVHRSRCLRLKAANSVRCKGSDYGGGGGDGGGGGGGGGGSAGGGLGGGRW